MGKSTISMAIFDSYKVKLPEGTGWWSVWILVIPISHLSTTPVANNRSAGHCSADHRMWDTTWVPFPTIPPPCPFHSKHSISFHARNNQKHPTPIPNRSPTDPPPPHPNLAIPGLPASAKPGPTRLALRFISSVSISSSSARAAGLPGSTLRNSSRAWKIWDVGPGTTKGFCREVVHVMRKFAVETGKHIISWEFAPLKIMLNIHIPFKSDGQLLHYNFQIEMANRKTFKLMFHSAVWEVLTKNTTYWETEHRFPMVWVKFAEPKGWQQVLGSHFDCLNSETLSLVGGAITILKNINQWEGLSHILWNIKALKTPTSSSSIAAC